MSEQPQTLADFIDARAGRPIPPDDVVHMLAPLLRQVIVHHAEDKVINIDPSAITLDAAGVLILPDNAQADPRQNFSAISDIQPSTGTALKVVGEYRVTMDGSIGGQLDDLLVKDEHDTALPNKPIFVLGYDSWEHAFGHHDATTDIYCLGLVLASLSCGIDFRERDEVHSFALNRDNLFRLFSRLHPVIATLIQEMTTLNRHDRAKSLLELTQRLETYRDQPAHIDVERLFAEAEGAQNRRHAVMTHLRDRLFDLSRRNRLIHFRPTQASVNCTESSVPMVMRLEAIKPDQLCTWGHKFSADVLGGKRMQLSKWLRFDDHPYLKASIDKLLQQSRRDKNEFGFNNLRLVIAFFNWRNLKERPQDAINSPLLWLPVTITKTKGVRDQYTLVCNEQVAEVNPALRFYLRQLYDIKLPDSLNLEEDSIEDFHQNLADQINLTEPNVTLTLQDKPVIEMIYQKASQRVRQFERKSGRNRKKTNAHRPDFSYAADDYRPLGLSMFKQLIRPAPLPQRSAVGSPMPVRGNYAVAPSDGSTERSTYSLGKTQAHEYDWSVELTQITLANLNYKKMSLVRDYNDLIDSGRELPSFDRIFSVQPRDIETATPPPLDVADQWGVVASDATQSMAIALARQSDSFIIQGPPGTGKSQTITNLIADYVARGKRVLFVCEKRAALDVVYYRLKQVGLDRLATIVHDSQEDKKAFVHDMKSVYEDWIEADHEHEYHVAHRTRTTAAYHQHMKLMAQFETAMQSLSEGDAGSVRDLLGRRLEFGDQVLDLSATEREALPNIAQWDTDKPAAERIQRAFQSSLGVPSFASHVFSKLKLQTLESETYLSDINAKINEADQHIDVIEDMLADGNVLAGEDTSLGQALETLEHAQKAVDTGLHHSIDLLDPNSETSARFTVDTRSAKEAAASVDEAAEKARNWKAPLDPSDAREALQQARRQEPSFFKFFNGSWRKLKRIVREKYDFNAHAATPRISDTLNWLVEWQTAQATQEKVLQGSSDLWRSPDFAALSALRGDWLARIESDKPFAALIQRVQSAPVPANVFTSSAKCGEALSRLQHVTDAIFENISDLPLSAVFAQVRDLQSSLDDLPDVLPATKALQTMSPNTAGLLRRHAATMDQLEASVLDEEVNKAFRVHPVLQTISIEQLEGSVRRARNAKELLEDQNASSILSGTHQKFKDHLKTSLLSATQLDEKEKAFKKIYSSGRRAVENEFRKSMRYKSIRDLGDGDSGYIVRDLKPIWLMSPLSVSDTLPLSQDEFDVVIFDEASQIPMEEAVPALCRAPQVIVVGDEMQLPPTSFFSTSTDEDDAQVDVEEDGQTIAIVLDADSLLNQAARNLPATLLSWHYRSRSETLISFSNAAFYDGRLTTVPDVQRAAAQAATQDTGGSPATRLLDKPITFHKLDDSPYHQRRNSGEAKYIAELVRELLLGDSTKSIGIVAFSEAQQDEVENALTALAGEDSTFSAALDEAYLREDDGQFNGLFIKNLENVQGDERDIIILSICYGPDTKGKMRMNFGPINQRGGEKRLNVIFSRAKHHMAIVTSITAESITNIHNDGARALRTFLAFAQSNSDGAQDAAMASLTTLNPDAKRIFGGDIPANTTRAAIAAQLRARGMIVDEWVGSASFRCDLAIRSDDAKSYALGILLDGKDASGEGRQFERYVFQPGLLEAFGWRVIDIPTSQWFNAPHIVLDRIEAALTTRAPDAADFDPFDSDAIASLQLGTPQKAAPAIPPKPRKARKAVTTVREFHFIGGKSRKFWRIEITGSELDISYGRIGTDGQTLLKSYDSPKRAKTQAEKLINEKLSKGYSEVPTETEDQD